eukprot:Lithocolla_globosa_v1_NODE_618_length_3583_cov_3.898810.p4 type:complete len:207 gc:universal NODE_618_length_3583_cov_3.898810:2630-2010(-)
MPGQVQHRQRVSEHALNPAPVVLKSFCTGASASQGGNCLISRVGCGSTTFRNRQAARLGMIRRQPVAGILVGGPYRDFVATQLQRGSRRGGGMATREKQGGRLHIAPIICHMEPDMPLRRKIRHHSQQLSHVVTVIRQQHHIVHDKEGREELTINVQAHPFILDHGNKFVHEQNKKQRGQDRPLAGATELAEKVCSLLTTQSHLCT